MSDTQMIAVVVGVVVVVVVFLLKDKIFNIKGSRDGFAIDNKPPEQRPGISAKRITSLTGSATVENNQGDGVDAKDFDIAKNVVIKNNPPPKT